MSFVNEVVRIFVHVLDLLKNLVQFLINCVKLLIFIITTSLALFVSKILKYIVKKYCSHDVNSVCAMSKEGYGADKKEGDNKVVLERLQTYLKDKRTTEVLDPGVGYNKPGTSFEQNPHTVSAFEDSSNILREVLNFKKAELLRHPDIIAFLKTIASDLKK